MICLDANVLIEIVLDRHRAQACRAYINSAREDLAVTLLSLDLVMYLAEGQKLDLGPIQDFLRLFIWLPITDSDAEWAFRQFHAKDFEDALQIGCALRENCTTFVTLDKSLAKKYGQNIETYLLH